MGDKVPVSKNIAIVLKNNALTLKDKPIPKDRTTIPRNKTSILKCGSAPNDVKFDDRKPDCFFLSNIFIRAFFHTLYF